MNILVTGAAGFIGSHLSEKLLDEGHRVVGFDNFDPFYKREIKEENIKYALSHDSFKLVEGDIRNFEDLSKISEDHDFEVVVHLAAKAGVRPSIEDPVGYSEVNLIGTQNVLEMMKSREIKRLVFASSSSVYGNSTEVPYKETMNVNNPISPYAATKIAGEVLCHNYWHLYGISVTCLRFFTVYGPRQRPEMAIAKFVRNAYDKEPITVYGDGSASRDFTYVEDIIQGVMFAVEKDLNYEIINLGESETINLNDLLILIEELTEQKIQREYSPMQPGDVLTTYADIEKAQRLLNYKPATPVREGISKYIGWLEEADEISLKVNY